MKNSDIIKNADKIDSIFKSIARMPMSADELAQGIEKTLPSIKIVFSEEVEGNKGIEMTFDSEDTRDNLFEQMSKEFTGKLKFAKLSTEEYPETANKAGITGIPCLIVFKDGKEADRIIGFYLAAALKKKIKMCWKRCEIKSTKRHL